MVRTVPHISLRDLTLRYRSKRANVLAVDRVSLELSPRSFTSVIGPSGCGKTTLLKVVTGVLRPTSGEVLIDGKPLATRNLAGMFGYVFQRPLLLPWRTALENVALTAEVARKDLSRRDRLSEAQHWLEVVNLGGFENKLPHQLSGGMQQRVSLSRALALQPPILMMDEPFAALDEITRESLQDELLRLWGVLETTVLFVTHSISEAVLLSDHVVVMAAAPGRILETIAVDLPRPRTLDARETPEFGRYAKHIRALFESLGLLKGKP